MKTAGESVLRRMRILVVACAIVGWASTARTQDITITNFNQLAQVALSGDYSLWMPSFSPCVWRAYPTDFPLWYDSTSLTCLSSLPTSTNFLNSMDWSNVPLASVTLTRDVLTGVTTLEATGSTNVVATIAAPSGYEPGQCSDERWVWNYYVAATNNPDEWELTPGEIPPLTVTLQTYLVNSNAYYSIYATNLAAEAAAAADGSGGGFSPMFGGWGMDFGDDYGDACAITNDLIPFSVVSITPDGSGDMILTWQSCTDHVYVVQTESSLTPTSSWMDVAWMFGTDQATSWTDTNVVGLTQNFYQIVRLNPTNTNEGIPYGWAVTYGLDPLDPNLATGDPTGDGIDNLEKYDYGLNPQTPYPLNVTINTGNGFGTNQTISISTSNSPAFTFLEVSLLPNMTNAVVMANANSLSYVLPSNTNGIFSVFFQYADSHTNAIGPIIYKAITLDTIPPVVSILSPTNGTGNQAYVSLRATVYDPDPRNTNSPGPFRPVKIWINGLPYWNINGTQINIPRFPVLCRHQRHYCTWPRSSR